MVCQLVRSTISMILRSLAEHYLLRPVWRECRPAWSSEVPQMLAISSFVAALPNRLLGCGSFGKSADAARTRNLGFSCGGKSNQKIAQILYIAPGMVRVHVHAFAKVRSARSHSSSSDRNSERIGSRRTFRQSILSRAVDNDCKTSLTKKYSNPRIICEFLTPSPFQGEGWGGVKNLRLIYVCYMSFINWVIL